MEYVLGPLIALVVSLKYANHQSSKNAARIEAVAAKIEKIEERFDTSDKETLKRVMTTVMPIAKAVNKLNQEVGIRWFYEDK